jgi:hypothetical protein
MAKKPAFLTVKADAKSDKAAMKKEDKKVTKEVKGVKAMIPAKKGKK